jgi:hypothetical protein
VNDSAPILDSKGETRGHLVYSMVPSAVDEQGESISLVHYENAFSLLNQTLQVQFSIHGAKGLPEKFCTDAYCEYNWVDEAAEKYKTEEYSVKKTKNPKWGYTTEHDLFISNYVAENLQNTILMVGVYGKLSSEHMDNIIEDLGQRPLTAALLKTPDKNSGEFYEDKGGKQDVFKIDEENEDSEEDMETSPKKKSAEIEKKMRDLEKKLKKIQKENTKLKENTTPEKSRSSCCVIF